MGKQRPAVEGLKIPCYQTRSVRAQQKEATGTTSTAYKEKSKDTIENQRNEGWRQYRAEAAMKLHDRSEEAEKRMMEEKVQQGQCWEASQSNGGKHSPFQSMQGSWWQWDYPEKRYQIPELLVTLEKIDGKRAKGLMIYQIHFVHSFSRLEKYWAVPPCLPKATTMTLKNGTEAFELLKLLEKKPIWWNVPRSISLQLRQI